MSSSFGFGKVVEESFDAAIDKVTSELEKEGFGVLSDIDVAAKMKAKLDLLLGSDFIPWNIHDIRTAMATALAESGIPENIVDRILNHSASGSAPSAVARVYNQAEQLPYRARALDRWAEMVTGKVGDVVELWGQYEKS